MDKHVRANAGQSAEQRHLLEPRENEEAFARQAPGHPMPTIPREPVSR